MLPCPFSLTLNGKDCTLISIATGKRAQTPGELIDRLEEIHSGCKYYHFWGGLLVPCRASEQRVLPSEAGTLWRP